MARLLVIPGSVLTDHPVFLLFDGLLVVEQESSLPFLAVLQKDTVCLQGVDWHGNAVKDRVKIPATLAPGKYVLGFRYDCEATAQVWSNCADITIE